MLLIQSYSKRTLLASSNFWRLSFFGKFLQPCRLVQSFVFINHAENTGIGYCTFLPFAPATAKSPFSAQSLVACWGLTDCASPFHVQSNAGPETRNEKGSYGECWRLKKWHRKDVWMRKPKQDSLDGANAGVDVCSPVPDLNRQFKQTVNASLGASILKMIFLIFCVCLCWSKSKND